MATPAPLAKGLTPELKAKLTKLGVPIKAWDPAELNAVLHGHKTLGELAHVSKEKQLELQATGVKLLKDGLRDKAKQIFEGLEALDPYDAYVQVCLGTIAMEDEDLELAEERFTQAILLNPSSAPALAYRGELRLQLGRKTEALADLAAALTHDSKANAEVTARARTLLEAAKKSR
jgi:tetratricopeptide (TPR) repeat protein